jgi:class 3 adenylate cyclase
MFEKASGYVVLVDIDGYTQMKIDHADTVYLPIMEAFFGECEAVINRLRVADGNGYIIGDGAIFFFSAPAPNMAREVIATEIAGRLRKVFHETANEKAPGHDYKLSFAAGYCDFHIRRGVDLVGPEIDKLFSLVMSANDETILLNDRLFLLTDDL